MYCEGFSLAQVGAAFGVTRQSAYLAFKRRGWECRAKTFKPTVEFDGELYAPDPDGYWRKTRGDRKWLHHAVWESEHGPIPAGFHIHHVDHDTSNNEPSNLVCLSPSEHSKHHNPKGIVPFKPCVWCGKPLVRKVSGGQVETPAAVARRLYCDTKCSDAHKRGKPKGSSPRRDQAERARSL